MPGVEAVQVSRGKEEARVACADFTTLDDLQTALNDSQYTLHAKKTIHGESMAQPAAGYSGNTLPRIPTSRKYAEIGAAVLVIIGLYLLLRQFDILPKGVGIPDQVSFGAAFLIGLVAATSTCLAVAGGLLLAVAAKYNEKHKDATRRQKFIPHAYFNAGRIVSYTVFGGAVGALGSMITLSPFVTGIMTILASLLMLLMGIQLLHIIPWLNRFQLKMPKFIAHKLYDSSGSSASAASSGAASFGFGAATFFLPCGFTQALQLYVLSQGSIIGGALTMLAFSLGTLPSLLSVGAISSFASGNVRRHFVTFSAVLVIFLAVFNFPSGLALAGIPLSLPAVFGGGSSANVFPQQAPAAQQAVQQVIDPNVRLVNGRQAVHMSIVGYEYYPSQFTVMQGIPVDWIIDGTKAAGCAQVITLRKLGITEFLPSNQLKTITFTPTQLGDLPFSCSMGMTTPGARFTVVENVVEGNQAANVQNLGVGSAGKLPPPSPADAACNPEIQDCFVQKLSMEISRENGFFPNTFSVKKGIPVELEIDTKLRLGGCMGTMIIPDYGVAHVLSLGKTVLKFIPTREGVAKFTCSMGSHLGDFIVTA